MKSTRPLDTNEIRRVSGCFTGTFEIRNRGLYRIGVSTGERISELLSLCIEKEIRNKPEETEAFIAKAQDLCRDSILKNLEDGNFPVWNDLILGEESLSCK